MRLDQILNNNNKFKDYIILPGGADINPAIYGKKPHRTTGFYKDTDKKHIEMYINAVSKGIPVIGICRGHQLVAALNGLELIQDSTHSGGHDILVKNLENGAFDSTVYTNSCHHQMVWVNNQLVGKNYEVLGYTSKLSKHFHGEVDNEYSNCVIEPEIMWYPEVKALTFQFHPEWMDNSGQYGDLWKPCLKYIEELVNFYF